VPGLTAIVEPGEIPFVDRKYFEEIDWPVLKDWITAFDPFLKKNDFVNEKSIQGNPFKVIIHGEPKEITQETIIDAGRIIDDEKLLRIILEKASSREQSSEMGTGGKEGNLKKPRKGFVQMASLQRIADEIPCDPETIKSKLKKENPLWCGAIESIDEIWYFKRADLTRLQKSLQKKGPQKKKSKFPPE
jgi:hypothetical protein